MSALHRLALGAGLQIDWRDANGRPQRVSDTTLCAVLAALDLPTASESEIAESFERLRASEHDLRFVSADAGTPVKLPAGCDTHGDAELILEDGTHLHLAIEHHSDGACLPPLTQTGYHRLQLGARELCLAIAPPRCFGVADVAGGRRLWGPAIQLPSLRDERSLGFGDFGTLGRTAGSFAAAGADVLAISPTHALFPADPRRYSPYAPSSRLFLNILFGDPGLLGEPGEPVAEGALIDWHDAIPARVALLRRAFAKCDDATVARVAAFRAAGGEALEHHAIYDALHSHFAVHGATGWQGWPAAYHDPSSEAVAQFAAQHHEEIDFFAFAQWLATVSLGAAQKSAIDSGMKVGLISDLAVGMDCGGSHAWSRRDQLLTGLSIGAPPDLLGPDGQNWGITGFSPSALRCTGFEGFIATVRAGLDCTGGIRIDHALGMNRLWVVPDGGDAGEGAYLTYPMDDMLRLLAIESHRARAIVIGEDLGTIPDGLRPKLEDRQVLGMRVLWFERNDQGEFTPPAHWQHQAVAMTGTHDVPTVAGWWRGRDIDWNEELGRGGPDADGVRDRAARADERSRLWAAMQASGAANGPQPDSTDTEPVVDAALAHVGMTPCTLAIIPAEDVFGLTEQPNLPGTIDDHPNWRRRLPGPADALLKEPGVAARLDRLNKVRSE